MCRITEFFELEKNLRRYSYCFWNYLSSVHIEDDMSISVNGGVNFRDKEFSKFPFRFVSVMNEFNVYRCFNLETLEGIPEYVGGDFYLTNCPKIGEFDFFPKRIGGNIDIDERLLKIPKNLKIISSLENIEEKIITVFNFDDPMKLRHHIVRIERNGCVKGLL